MSENNEKDIEYLKREFCRLSAKFDLSEKNSREFDGMMLLKMDHNDFYRKLTIGIATGAFVVSLISLGVVIYVKF